MQTVEEMEYEWCVEKQDSKSCEICQAPVFGQDDYVVWSATDHDFGVAHYSCTLS